MNCPICGDKTRIIIKGARDNLYHLSTDEYEVVFCDKCGVGFSAPEISSEDLLKMYPGEYEAYSKRNSFWNVIQIYKYKQDMKIIKKYMRHNGCVINRIFEYGSGRGQFLHVLSKEFESEFTGIEMSEEGCMAAENLYGVKLLCVSAQKYVFAEKNDLVVMRHVLEHIDEFWDVLREIYDNGLEKNGVLFLKLPCFNSYEAEKFGKYWKSLDLPRHRVHFTDYGMVKILNNMGYKNIKVIRENVPTDYDESIQFRNKGRIYRQGGILRLIRCGLYQLILISKKKKAGRMMVLAQK